MFEDMYQELLLDHSKSEAYRGSLPAPCREAKAYNPLCGDTVNVFTRLGLAPEQALERCVFEGQGCVISQASVSLLMQLVEGKPREQALALVNATLAALRQEGPWGPELGKLRALEGVSQYPMRVKCATLGLRAMQATLLAPEEGVVEILEDSDD